MRHPGIVRNMLFSRVCNMVRERERERKRKGTVAFTVPACLKCQINFRFYSISVLRFPHFLLN